MPEVSDVMPPETVLFRFGGQLGWQSFGQMSEFRIRTEGGNNG